MTEEKLNFDQLMTLSAGSFQVVDSVEELISGTCNEESYWAHFSTNSSKAVQWLRTASMIDRPLVDAQLAKRVRPRLMLRRNALLIILRVPSALEASDPEELRSLRIYVDGKRMISTSLAPVPVVKELFESWGESINGDNGISDLFMELIGRAVKGLEEILEDLDDRADMIEQQVLEIDEDPEEGEVAALALDALQLRRYLAPQREVLSQLYEAEVPWLGAAKKQRVREIYERVCRQLEEVEVLRARVKIVKEQLSSHMAEEVNQRLYVFSVIAAIFLPLSFLTGLLGVNLGGIPGADSPIGFAGFCTMLSVFTAALVVIFKRISWI